MTKSPRPKKQPDQPNIHVGGDMIGDNIIIGHGNTINFQEALKATYGLFTIPQPVTDFTRREVERVGLKASFS